MRKALVSLVLACCLTLAAALATYAQAAPSTPPSGYSNSYTENGVSHSDAVTAISTSGSPNIISWDGSAWKKTSYGGSYGNGYDIWYQVKGGSSHIVSSGSSVVNHRYSLDSDGFSHSSIRMIQEIVFGGQFIRTSFIVENNSDKDMEISFGSGADIQIDDDDRATIEEKSNYGFQMTATNGKKRSFYFFGHDTPTVDPVDFWWVGKYNNRNSYYYYNPDGRPTSHNVYNTDSGMVYTWNKVHVPAGQTVKKSVLFGVGEADHVDKYLPIEVTFNSNDGTPVPSVPVIKGNKVPVPNPAPTRDSYQFAGWYADTNCRIPFDFDTPTNSQSVNMTLHAKWNYVISFGDGSDGLDDNTIIVDPDNPRLPDTLPIPPDREGEKFEGWFTDPECTKPVVPGGTITGPIDCYPKWTPTYKIIFNAPGCKPIPPQIITKGSKCPIPDVPLRDGYHFSGWYTDKKCTNKFDFNTPITCSLELYAKMDYVISFGDGTDGLPDHQIIVDSNDPRLPDVLPVPPEREDEEFQGWYTDPECTKPVKPGAPIDGPINFYPKWPSRHTIIFDTNGGTQIPPIKVTDGNLVTLPPEPTKPNNSFGGWFFIDPKCNYKKPFDPSMPITTGMTIFAEWLPHIDFETGSDKPMPPVVVTPDGHIDLPTPPSKPDKTFVGWFEDPEFTKPFDPTKPIDGPITLYPKYISLPKTGDNTPLFMLIAMLFASGAILTWTVRKKHA